MKKINSPAAPSVELGGFRCLRALSPDNDPALISAEKRLDGDWPSCQARSGTRRAVSLLSSSAVAISGRRRALARIQGKLSEKVSMMRLVWLHKLQ